MINFFETAVTEMSHFRFANRGMNLKDGLDTLKYFLFGLLFSLCTLHYICNGTRVFFQMLSFPCHQIRLIIFVAAFIVTNRVITDISSFVPDLMQP